MRTETQTVRIGENMGPIDWTYSSSKDMPQMWRDAESNPSDYLFNGRAIIEICMYDGWPYWEPRPAICFIGPLNSPEWTFFNSYGVHPESIQPRKVQP
ncbi:MULTISPECIES: hypothetical protein [unclassified Mesorhizobium]|uniref:hypothetical protein n=1 Tax=unclassified Mesorhizobium TaxID=325217 RepID=UPI001FE083F7|nr:MULTISPECIES: hypothetical protein [unclassified Mesorhizobium]